MAKKEYTEEEIERFKAETVEDTFGFFMNTLQLEQPDALAAFNRILEKCRLHKIKEMRYHVPSDQRLKEQYKKIYGKTDFKEFYIDYLRTKIKNKNNS